MFVLTGWVTEIIVKSMLSHVRFANCGGLSPPDSRDVDQTRSIWI
jgi:hypothetical protein